MVPEQKKNMLELKNLAKTYKPKKGVMVQALKGINLSFGERGLVFVLGKSGSGKSTLLNLIGGLDSVDNGEIVIKGKSSKDFKTADYDAYRNTYIGFIFQEYNILNEFTVGENISLAIELQNKKVDRQLLDNILKEVELEGCSDRKPNELSGGQKQRVAIARALIKSPQIVLADEPTGALDSATGKAIFDTFKKISKEKLVIIVSHDREFAEKYGDRVIELADGEVISDTEDKISNEQINKGAIEEGQFIRSRLPYRHAFRMGVSGVGNKPFRLIITIILCMVSFTMFGVVDTFNSYDAKKVAVNSYIDAFDYDVSAITCYTDNVNDALLDAKGASEKDVERLKQKTGIDYVGATFLNDKEGCSLELISTDELTGRNSSNYYTKKLYGFYPASKEFFNTMNFRLVGDIPKEENEIVITQYVLDQMNIAGLTAYTKDSNDIISSTVLLPDPSRTAKSIVEQCLYIKVEDIYWKIVGIIDTNADKSGKFNTLKPSDNAETSDKQLFAQDCKEYFRYGYHSLGFISQDKYDAIVDSHKYDTESWDAFGIPARGDILVTLRGSSKVNFWGVASDKDLNRVKEIIWLDGNERTSLQDNEYVIGLDSAINLLQDDFQIENNTYIMHDETYFDGNIAFKPLSLSMLYHTKVNYIAWFISCCEEAENVEFERMIPFIEYISEKGSEALSCLYGNLRNSQINNYVIINDEFIEKDFARLEEKHWRALYASYLFRDYDWRYSIDNFSGEIFEMSCGYRNNITGGRTGETLKRIDAKVIYIKNKLNTLQEQKVYKFKIEYQFEDTVVTKPSFEDSTIVGIYVPKDDFPSENNMDTFVFNNVMYRSMEKTEPLLYSFLLAPMPRDRAGLQKLMDMHYEDGGRVLKMHNGIIVGLDLVQVPVNAMSKIFLIVGLGLVLFAVLMMGNYIATTISNKKREIGILRALGAKTSDVFAIFVNESIIIALINAAASIVVTAFTCIGLNVVIKNMTGVNLSVLNFGIRQIAIMMAISIAIALVASLIPIYRMSNKKPIDCIRDR